MLKNSLNYFASRVVSEISEQHENQSLEVYLLMNNCIW